MDVRELRAKIAEKHETRIEQVVLTYRGRLMADGRTLEEVGITDLSTVYALLRGQRAG
jgi:aspartate 1-decarboxylase